MAPGAANGRSAEHGSAGFHLQILWGYPELKNPEQKNRIWMDTANTCPQPQILLNSSCPKPPRCCHCTLWQHLQLQRARILNVQLTLTGAVCPFPPWPCHLFLASDLQHARGHCVLLTLKWGNNSCCHSPFRDVTTAQSLWFPQFLPLQWLT